jgi:hypothetical protein
MVQIEYRLEEITSISAAMSGIRRQKHETLYEISFRNQSVAKLVTS